MLGSGMKWKKSSPAHLIDGSRHSPTRIKKLHRTSCKNSVGVFEDDVDMDEEITNQAKSDCGQEPEDTVLVIITKDGDFRELVIASKQKGVSVT